MYRAKRIARALVSVGVVDRVDTVNREMAVFVNGALRTFDIPVGCTVVLHGEPVKLRMVQPRDRVKITHARHGVPRVALAVEVQPNEIAGRAARTPSRIGCSEALDDFHPGLVDS